MTDDKRPYLYADVEAPYGHIELTVQGAEGEDADDLTGMFDDKLRKCVDAQKELAGEDEDDRGFE